MAEVIPVINPLDALEPAGSLGCFACSPRHPHGLKLEFFQHGEIVFAEFAPRHDVSGIYGIVHGGIQATLLDEVMWWTVFQLRQRFCVTKDMRVEFKNTVRTSMRLRLEARITGDGKNLVHLASEIRHESRVLATATGSYFLPNQKAMARTQGMKREDLPATLRRYLPE